MKTDKFKRSGFGGIIFCLCPMVLLSLVGCTPSLSQVREWRQEKEIEPLLETLQVEEEAIRAEAAKALGEIGKPAVVPLIGMLQDEEVLKRENAGVRGEIAEILGKIGDPRAVGSLIVMLKEEDPATLMKAALALKRIGIPAIYPLIKTLKDEDWRLRAKAAWILKNIGNAKASNSLLEALSDEVPEVRWTAAQALGKVGDRRAIRPLEELFQNDTNSRVRTEAQRAVWKIRRR